MPDLFLSTNMIRLLVLPTSLMYSTLYIHLNILTSNADVFLRFSLKLCSLESDSFRGFVPFLLLQSVFLQECLQLLLDVVVI